jgi:predicted nucleic acid-binding protein
MPVEDLTTLPARTSVFVDTIIFDLHFKNKSVACSALMRRIALREVVAYVNTQVIADLIHKSMLVEAYDKGLITSPSHQKLKRLFMRDGAAAQRLTDHQQQIEYLLDLGIKVLSVTRKTIIESKAERRRHALMTGDSIHVHTMNNHRVRLFDIATHDSDMANVAGMNVWVPTDVINAPPPARRPVSINLADSTYGELDAAAKAAGRVLQDEIVWRLEQSV